jgi:hypothetical protein
MTPIALTMLIVAAVLVWGGLITSIIILARHPEVKQYPDGGVDHLHEQLDD